MTGEAAAEVCASIAREVRAWRAGEPDATSVLNDLVGSLLAAPATTIADALALAAISRRLLSSSFGEHRLEDLAGRDDATASAVFALAYLHRAIQILEVETGLSAEGFTGEAEHIN